MLLKYGGAEAIVLPRMKANIIGDAVAHHPTFEETFTTEHGHWRQIFQNYLNMILPDVYFAIIFY